MKKAFISRYRWAALSFVLFFALQVGLQVRSGAFHSELGGHPDEASHYVTGLMVGDFMRAGDIARPMEFAENYYIHYPKVAFGHWPPLFYVLQAAWSYPFSPSRESILTLMAVLTGLLALSVAWFTRREFGVLPGMLAGLLLLVLPLVRKMSGMVMAEILLALLMFWAAVFLGRFLETGRRRDALGFSAFAILSALTKGNGLALMLTPFLASAAARRWDVLRDTRFWVMLLIVLGVCGPFYWATLDMARNGWQQSLPSVPFTQSALAYYSGELLKLAGIVAAVMAFAGVLGQVVVPFLSGGAEGRWAALAAMLLSVMLFHFVVPCGLESRHLVPLASAFSIFAVAGAVWTARRLTAFGFQGAGRAAVCLMVVGMIFSWEVFFEPRKSWSGFGKAAERLLMDCETGRPVLMVASDSTGEGVFVSEIAMREERPGHVVLRASKMLSESRWDGSEYKLLYDSTREVMDFLESVPVRLVMVDRSVPAGERRQDLRLLDETLRAYEDRWQMVAAYPVNRHGRLFPKGLLVYRLTNPEKQGEGKIIIKMDTMLGKSLEKNL